MATSGRNTKRRHYHTPGVVNGNLARDLRGYELERKLETSGQLDFDKQYRKRKETEAELIARQRARAKAAVRPAQKVSTLAVLGFSSVAVLMVALLMCYVQINTISTNIVEMKRQIGELEVEQVSLMTRYEQAFDPSAVKEAAESYGMSQPTESQIYYIDLPGQDQAVACSREETGVLSRVFAAMGSRIYTVVEYFR